jgi:signal transduction histidine kinase
MGIPKDELERIFDPFFSTKEVGAGTGLGLSIVYGIIEKHRGTITVESREGEGTRFTIRLPLEAPGKSERQAA